MASFNNTKGGDLEGLQNHNKKKPEKEKTTPSSVVDTLNEKPYVHNPIERLGFIESTHLKEIYELSENILVSARAIQDKIKIYSAAQMMAEWDSQREIKKDA